ncbi:MAG TPA: hypothetical protein GXZ23_06185 [Clostridiales bacterium]|jgi:hypothetical protein|nr:hypothetical protein [Clostridiales bacterium]
MALFYVKNDEPFIPEAINPEFAITAQATIKAARIGLKLTMKTSSLKNAAKIGKIENMHEIIQKALVKNGEKYSQYMNMTGCVVGEVDDAFFADKDEEFYKNQIAVLCDMAAIDVVIESGLFGALSGSIKHIYNKTTEETFFFTNQTEIIKPEITVEE